MSPKWEPYREWIVGYMTRHDITATELSNRAGIAPSTLLRALNSEKRGRDYEFGPSLSTIRALESVIGRAPKAVGLRKEKLVRQVQPATTPPLEPSVAVESHANDDRVIRIEIRLPAGYKLVRAA